MVQRSVELGSIVIQVAHLPQSQEVVDVFDTKTINPTGAVRWDPGHRKGLRVALGPDYNCTEYPDVTSSSLSCTIGPGAGTGLVLNVEVGGVIVKSSTFGYACSYKAPHVYVESITPVTGPTQDSECTRVWPQWS